MADKYQQKCKICGKAFWDDVPMDTCSQKCQYVWGLLTCGGTILVLVALLVVFCMVMGGC